MHFKLPETIRICLVDNSGLPLRLPKVVVLVSYGYAFPPLQTDDHGCLTVTAEMFRKAKSRQKRRVRKRGTIRSIGTSRFESPLRQSWNLWGQRRKESRWPIMPFEQEIYKDLDSLCCAYTDNRNASVRPATLYVDLAQVEATVDVALDVAESIVAV